MGALVDYDLSCNELKLKEINMGTGHLIAVIHNKEYKVAQYGQWDGYPSSQGIEILSFFRSKRNIDNLVAAFPRCRFYDAEGNDRASIDSYNKNSPSWSSDPDNRTDAQKAWFRTFISRDLGAKVLTNIAAAKDDEILLKNSIAFAGDSVFCEWAYVVDLDARTLEVYTGFNQKEVTDGRFLSSDANLDSSKGYHPVTLAKVYSLDSLPSDDDFIAELDASEEESED